VATQSKACVCGGSLAGIVVSNPAGCMDVCIFVLQRSLRWVIYSSREFLPNVVCLSVISKHQ
jgi:hypothetical protein